MTELAECSSGEHQSYRISLDDGNTFVYTRSIRSEMAQHELEGAPAVMTTESSVTAELRGPRYGLKSQIVLTKKTSYGTHEVNTNTYLPELLIEPVREALTVRHRDLESGLKEIEAELRTAIDARQRKRGK